MREYKHGTRPIVELGIQPIDATQSSMMRYEEPTRNRYCGHVATELCLPGE